MEETCPCQCHSSTLKEGLCGQHCVGKSLQDLRDAQTELASTMQQLATAQTEVLAAQKELVQLVTAHVYDIHKSRPQSESSMPDERPCLSLDAGRRLVKTYELLELCLLNLPNGDILLAQRVNKQFKSVIDSSSQLQRKLFFAIDPTAGIDWRTEINPMFALETVQNAIPLFFDHKEKRLAYCHREGRTRLYCRSIKATTARVYMDLTPKRSVGDSWSPFEEIAHRTRILEKGSWKRMFLAQPSCDIHWHVRLTECRGSGRNITSQTITYSGYSGIVKYDGRKTLDVLMDALANSTVKEGG